MSDGATAQLACPECGGPLDRIIDSRPHPTYVRRRRVCIECGGRHTTMERLGKAPHNALSIDEVLDRALRWIESQPCPMRVPETRRDWFNRRTLIVHQLRDTLDGRVRP